VPFANWAYQQNETSFSKFCFENAVENFEMLKRAFGGRREEQKFLGGFSSSETAGPH
jgi:hypothetical protein